MYNTAPSKSNFQFSNGMIFTQVYTHPVSICVSQSVNSNTLASYIFLLKERVLLKIAQASRPDQN